MHECIKCGVILISGENWYTSRIKCSSYICNSCARKIFVKYRKDNREHYLKLHRKSYYKNGGNPMSENKECSAFLGIHIAEKVLSKVFKDVKIMPNNNPGFDFRCNHGKTIDVKSACINIQGGWGFKIKRNTIVDYFLCIAFDNRENLNPLHVWLLPGNLINHLISTSICKSTLSKWDKYKLDIAKTIACCDNMKGEIL